MEGAGAIHHVVSRGAGSRAIVFDDDDRRAFVRRLSRAVVDHEWVCWAYCLMDNHFHLIVETPEPNLGAGMRWLKGTFAQDVNHRHGRSGHLFGGRFHSILVETEEHAVAAALYVVLNPVRAGLVSTPSAWPWSSYRATSGIERCPAFLAVDRVLALFDQRPAVARRRFGAAAESLGVASQWGQTRGV